MNLLQIFNILLLIVINSYAQNRIRPYWIHRQRNMQVGRSDAGAAAVQNYVLFAGGWSTELDEALSSAEIYDIEQNNWIPSSSNLSAARRLLTGGNIGSKAFFAGGEVSGNIIDIFDANDMSWSNYEMDNYRVSPYVVSIGTKLYVTGGGAQDADFYDLNSDSWDVFQLNWNSTDTIAVADDRYAVFVSGSEFQIFDSQLDSWFSNSSTTTAILQDDGVGIVGGKVIFYREDLLELFDIGSYAFTIRNLPTKGRSFAKFEVSGSKAWVAGGTLFSSEVTSFTNFTNLVEAYDFVQDKWTTHHLKTSSRKVGGSASINDSVVFFGGEGGPDFTPSPDIDIFDDSGKHAFLEGFDHSGFAMVVTNNTLFIGGNTNYMSDLNETGVDILEYFPLINQESNQPVYYPSSTKDDIQSASTTTAIVFALLISGCAVLVAVLAAVKYWISKKRQEQVKEIEKSTLELNNMESKGEVNEDYEKESGFYNVEIRPVRSV